MNFGDAVVIDINGLAEGILGDFEPSVQIPSQSCFEVEPKREAEGVCLQLLQKLCPMGRLSQNCEEVVGHRVFILSARGSQDPSSVDGGILMVDAGWERQDDKEFTS